MLANCLSTIVPAYTEYYGQLRVAATNICLETVLFFGLSKCVIMDNIRDKRNFRRPHNGQNDST